MDQQKTLDMISYEWVALVLSHGNVGTKNFIKWVTLLYEVVMSKVVVNGTLSETFELGRGVKQGDTLSMIIYVLSLAPLLEMI